MKRLISLCFLCLILVFSSQEAFGEWQGPVDVIVGEWGRGGTQFGFESGDMQDGFPFHFDISTQGMILIADIINGRIKLYNSTGMLLKIIVPPVEDPRMWILKPVFLRSKIILPINKLYFFSFDGKIDKVSDYPKSLERINNWQVNDDKLYLEQANPYTCGVLSSESQLLKTYPERPLELGRVEERSLGDGRYRVTIKYPDITYTLNKGPYEKYVHICKENIYAISGKSVEKFNTSGEVLEELIIPEDQRKVIRPAGGGFEERSEVIVEYGQPVVAPNGDVYTWKRTPDKYSIVRWVWVDGPEAPQGLRIAPSRTGITLFWEQPQKDADTVTAYEINRSSTVCGPFRPIGTVKKNILTYEDRVVRPGENYYYQIRAIRDKTPSGYSNKAMGKR